MARHNREGHGADQRGYEYTVSYQPDWLRRIKVTRNLESGRQSTKTLFRNPADRQEAQPGDRIRTRITCPAQGMDFEVAVDDASHGVQEVRVAYQVEGNRPRDRDVVFTLQSGLNPPRE